MCGCLGGLALEDNQERHLSKELFSLKKRFWKSSDPVERELKGRYLLNKRAIQMPRNREFARELMSLLREVDATIFAILDEEMARTSDILIKEQGYLSKPAFYLLQRISQFMKESHPDRKAILIFDGQEREQNKNVAKAFSNFLFQGRSWKEFENIYTTPFFADSVSTPGVQMADFIAYCMSAYECRRQDLKQFREELYDIRFKSTFVNMDEEGREYVINGVYKMQKGTGEPEGSATPRVR